MEKQSVTASFCPGILPRCVSIWVFVSIFGFLCCDVPIFWTRVYRLYLVGGIGDDGVALDSVEGHDPDTDSWAESILLHVSSGERFDPVTGRREALPDMTVTQASVIAAIHP